MALRVRAWLALGAFIYVIALSWTYVHIVAPAFTYLGYGLVGWSWWPVFVATALAVVPAIWLPQSLGRPSQVVYWMLYLLVYVPSLAIPVLAVDPQAGTVLAHGLVLLVG